MAENKLDHKMVCNDVHGDHWVILETTLVLFRIYRRCCVACGCGDDTDDYQASSDVWKCCKQERATWVKRVFGDHGFRIWVYQKVVLEVQHVWSVRRPWPADAEKRWSKCLCVCCGENWMLDSLGDVDMLYTKEASNCTLFVLCSCWDRKVKARHNWVIPPYKFALIWN